MASASRVLYIGVTNNIERRAMTHGQGRVTGFSAKYKTRELVYVEAFGDVRARYITRKTAQRLVARKELRIDSIQQPEVEGPEQELAKRLQP